MVLFYYYLCTVFDLGDCSIGICLLYCIVFVCVLYVFSDNFHVWLLYYRICGPTKLYVYMCVCTCTTPKIWFGHWLPDIFFCFSAPISSHLTLPLSWRWIPKSMHLLCYKFYLQTRPLSTDFFYQFYITNIANTFSCKLHTSVENRRKHTVWFSVYSIINLLRWVLPTHTRTFEIQGKYRHLKHF